MKKNIGIEKFTIGMPGTEQIIIRGDYSVPLINEDYDFKHHLIYKLSNDLKSQLEIAIIEGLKRKGFEFEHRIVLEQFVKRHCRCEDNIDSEERVYYVDEIPFFLHKYQIEIDSKLIIEDRQTLMVANYGSFAYL